MYMIMRTRTYIHIKTPTQMCINTYIYKHTYMCWYDTAYKFSTVEGIIQFLFFRNSFPPFT